MGTYIKKIIACITELPTYFSNGICNANSVLDILYQHYSEFDRSDNDVIINNYDILYAYMDQLCLRDKDKIIDTVCNLCVEHERIAFISGVQIGVHLAQELSND